MSAILDNCNSQLACASVIHSRIGIMRSTSIEWTDNPWSHWSNHPRRSTKCIKLLNYWCM